MKGTRPLDNNEIRLVSACFTGTYEVRNRGLIPVRREYWRTHQRVAQPNDRGRVSEPQSRHRSPV